MKKLKYLLVAAVLPLMMTSCWETPDQGQDDPMTAGFWIYNTAVIQSTYALDPAAIAFRLNCLLTDKQLQGVDKLDDVKTEAEALEKKFLFGEMTRIEENYNGVAGDYRILFDITSDKGQSDRARGGAVIISTGNKLLTDLAEDDAWVIEVDPNAQLNYILSDAEQIIVEGASTYTITSSLTDGGYTSFNVTIEDFASKSHVGIYTSKCRGVYSIIPQFVIDPENKKVLSMAEARKAIYKMSIAIAGPTFAALDSVNQTNIVYYTTEDNVYKPSCSMSNGVVYRSSGDEYVALSGTFDQEVFPSSFVTVKFSGSGDCGSVSATMTYNGENRVI